MGGEYKIGFHSKIHNMQYLIFTLLCAKYFWIKIKFFFVKMYIEFLRTS